MVPWVAEQPQAEREAQSRSYRSERSVAKVFLGSRGKAPGEVSPDYSRSHTNPKRKFSSLILTGRDLRSAIRMPPACPVEHHAPGYTQRIPYSLV